MILLQSLLFCAGIVALYFGAEWLVKGASRFAYFFNIKPIVIGLTIIALTRYRNYCRDKKFK